MSDIRVAVQWKSAAVFAGEDVECTITFKNVARAQRSPSPNSQLRGHGFHRDRRKDNLPAHIARRTSVGLQRQDSTSSILLRDVRTHSPSLSLTSRQASNSVTGIKNAPPPPQESGTTDSKHRRRLSIVSMGGGGNEEINDLALNGKYARPPNGHSRAASMQILPRRNRAPSPTSASGYERAFTVPSPLIHTSMNSPNASPSAYTMARSRSQTNSLNNITFPSDPRKYLARSSSFKTQSSLKEEPENTPGGPKGTERIRKAPTKLSTSRPLENGEGRDPINPISKILSPGSINGTPRSSGEFYSMSNDSGETLASEYVMPDINRSLLQPGHSRQSSVVRAHRGPTAEVLMMGYGQVTGSCVLDGSLINQGPFEEVKRKAIVGGRGGGGVVRSSSTKRDGGLLGSFGLSNLGDSLGGLLGGNEMSSIRDAKKSNSARSIPLLSTPQSILFVDLRIEPGESKSFTFKHPLPSGLPPSHKGKAMKVIYNLVIGTQRSAQKSQHNQVQRVEIPFRVLTSVNPNGDMLGHDLMSPYTILSNQATAHPVEVPIAAFPSQHAPAHRSGSSEVDNGSAQDFSNYAELLLAESQDATSHGLRSPTELDSRKSSMKTKDDSSMKDIIETAILRSNAPRTSNQSANRFEIKRGGYRVAIVMLARPFFRLGEVVAAAIDFKDADIPCFSVHASLETWETVDPTIALRSKASIHRVTRKVYAHQRESSISASRIYFSPTIPSSAVPEFITSGVNLEWGLRFEFVTNRFGDADDPIDTEAELLEEVLKDERGTVRAAVQGLLCEMFDVTVPLRVFGSTGPFDEDNESGEYRI